ncbi:Six-hairpin glycosidase [Cutaneotrichosporon oleaginosum]|uniref:Six-hairpin glycosidase n=1 Tax=Cutaneotrichosporon oleaginosum TaxID=879819 RepID=A0A0J0XCZ7_9TREE|nr:Six-hairpin glycosidase [Cutaneotrichosporon oleaginosum]KLT38936.1 Six-hairpin glycosidase [Cutaneotrichosporon oleaginosum]TXT07585.1 hypothetical protein COLE_04509 [Cutaneotrichosporon oleaginosum]
MRTIFAAAALAATAHAVHLTPEQLNTVWDHAVRLSNFSWENGTIGQTLLEWKYPQLSVFAATAPLPLPDLTPDQVPDIVRLASDTLANRPRNFSNPALPAASSSGEAPQRRQETPTSPLLEDGAAGDPPSVGVAVLVADKAMGGAQVNGVSFMQAAQSQLDYLLYGVPRNADGAISHRAASAQLWADNVYMVPPFMAYFGAVTNNQTLVQAAFDQIAAYRKGLQDGETKLWRHMSEGPEAEDPNLWATGNAWAAAGIMRVLATIKRSQFAGAMGDQMTQLQVWAAEIMTASKKYMTHDGLLRNYINNGTDFVDAAATALMASAGFRMSTLNLTNDHVDMAVSMLAGASRNVNATGFLVNVTDPYSFHKPGTYSPEGNAFVVLGYAAYNDWERMGKPGNTRGKDPLAGGAGRVGVSAVVGAGAAAAAALAALVV